jgi:hypothetical protein
MMHRLFLHLRAACQVGVVVKGLRGGCALKRREKLALAARNAAPCGGTSRLMQFPGGQTLVAFAEWLLKGT